MIQFLENQTLPNRDTAFKELQLQGYKLWQWLDHTTTVWWGRGQQRLLVEELPDGVVRVGPLPELAWENNRNNVGTIANDRDSVRGLKESVFKS